MVETILQHWIFTQFALPFLLMFFIVYAVLEKTKILGDNKQTNSIVSFVIALIFVSAVFPKLVVANLILFLTVAIIVVFVGLLIWGFVSGGEAKISGKKLPMVAGIIIAIAVVAAVLWATGIGFEFIEYIFVQEWSNAFWTNVLFVAVIAAALGLALKKE
jgi:hypothetical protein